MPDGSGGVMLDEKVIFFRKIAERMTAHGLTPIQGTNQHALGFLGSYQRESPYLPSGQELVAPYQLGFSLWRQGRVQMVFTTPSPLLDDPVPADMPAPRTGKVSRARLRPHDITVYDDDFRCKSVRPILESLGLKPTEISRRLTVPAVQYRENYCHVILPSPFDTGTRVTIVQIARPTFTTATGMCVPKLSR